MIIPEYETIFIHIPKTAGTSIEIRFNMCPITYNAWHHGTDKPQCRKHDTISDMKIKFPEEYDSYAKFTVVRNPYDRMVSWYFYLKDKVERDGFDLKKDFTNFIKWIEDPFKTSYTKWSLTDPGDKDPNPLYLNPQHTYVDETVTVLKYENLSDDLNDYFGKEIKLPIVNKSSLRKGHFLNYYNKRSLDIVYERYKEDFEKFNYKRIEKI